MKNTFVFAHGAVLKDQLSAETVMTLSLHDVETSPTCNTWAQQGELASRCLLLRYGLIRWWGHSTEGVGGSCLPPPTFLQVTRFWPQTLLFNTGKINFSNQDQRHLTGVSGDQLTWPQRDQEVMVKARKNHNHNTDGPLTYWTTGTLKLYTEQACLAKIVNSGNCVLNGSELQPVTIFYIDLLHSFTKHLSTVLFREYSFSI